jgi:hypothetical protein
MTGVGISFTWDKEKNVVKMGADKYATGLVHSSYGPITANVLGATYSHFEAGQLLNIACDAFYFNFKWTVSAGSFGEYPNLFIVEKVL